MLLKLLYVCQITNNVDKKYGWRYMAELNQPCCDVVVASQPKYYKIICS